MPAPAHYTPDGPGYDPYSFEAGGDFAAEEPTPVAEPDFSLFDMDDEDLDLDNPEDWLDALASGAAEPPAASKPAPADEVAVVDDVMSRLNQAKEVTPAEIEGMFDALFKKAEQYAYLDSEPAATVRLSPVDEDSDTPITAEIPDWLQEQMVTQVPDAAPVSAQSVEDISAILDAPEPAEMPEWLQAAEPDGAEMPAAIMEETPQDDVSLGEELPDWLQTEETETEDISGIFVDDEPTLPEPVKPPMELELDTSDSLVLALKQEAENEEELIAWYENQLRKTTGAIPAPDLDDLFGEVVPAEEDLTPVPTGELQAADLPLETDLPAGEPENVPDWLLGDAAATVTLASEEGMPEWLIEATSETEAVAVETDMPDWLREQAGEEVQEDVEVPDWLQAAGSEVNLEEIPDWLLQTMTDEQNAVSVDIGEQDDESVTMPAVVAPPVRTLSPAPVPPAAASIDAQKVLQAARSKVSAKDIDGALLDYEAIIRANTSLDTVLSDLSKLVEDTSYKKNPAVYRVLGDGLMRRGMLQQALETYRRALNLL